mgnify:CR=1 FL=1
MGDIVNELRSMGCIGNVDGRCTCSIGESAAHEIELLRAELAEAHLRGVKAGLEAAMVAVWKASRKRKPEDLIGLGCYLAGAEIAAIDPASIKPDDTGEGGADG